MNKKKLILSSGIANSFEWYDYALFGHFAQIIGEKFFPDSDPSISLLQAFLVFAVGYLMRPLGGVFFGIIGDRFGRRSALSAAVICMSVPTACIGILPTYDDIGITATTLMIVVRMLQGLSMGGALTGSVSFIIEHTSRKHRGFIGSIPMASICIGILLGSLVSSAIKNLLSPEDFYDWGWRLPFMIGVLILFVGIYIRKHTQETPMFKEMVAKDNVLKSPLRKVIANHWFDMLISIFINSTGSVIFYLQSIYLTTYLKNNREFDESSVDLLVSSCYLLMAFVTVITGWFSDIIGRKNIFIIYNIAIILIFAAGLLGIFETGNFASIVTAQVILAIIAAAYIGPEPALQAEFYPANVRNTALSVSYNTATSLFGGTTPFVIAYLVQKTNSINSSMYYVLACAVASLIALFFYKDRSKVVSL